MKHLPLCGLLASALYSVQAFGLEALKTYDNFSASTINGALWLDGERSMSVKSGQLQLAERMYGQDFTNVGQVGDDFGTNVANPQAVTEMEAKITVNAFEVDACPTNSAVAQSRARIVGSFFNIATPTVGSQLNDALAQVRLVRQSNSTDPAGVLEVQGLLSYCTEANCNTTSTVQLVSLGTVTTGQSAVVEMQWDQPNHQFLFSRDGGTYTGTVAYTLNDTQPPGTPFKKLSGRVDVDNCEGSAPLTGYVSASFDNVKVNASAVP